MLKHLLLVAALLAAPAIADPVEASSAKDAALAAKCASGCVVFDQADVAALLERVNSFAQQAYLAGLVEGEAAGAKAAFEALKNNPKLCPKDI